MLPKPFQEKRQLPTEEALDKSRRMLPEMLDVLRYRMEAIGARVGEVLARKWQAIDWQEKRLWIYVNVYKGEFFTQGTSAADIRSSG